MKKLHIERVGALVIALDDDGRFFAVGVWIPARQGVSEAFPVLLASPAYAAPRIDPERMAAALARSPRVRKLLRVEPV